VEEVWVRVGRIGKPFGLRGEVVIHYYGDTAARFAPGSRVFVLVPGDRVEARVSGAREMPKKFVASFEGRDRIEAIEPWVGCEVEVPARDLPPLEEGRYYHFQLIGLRVYAADGRFLGVVEEIVGTGGNDVYCVRDGRREVLIPGGGDAIAGIDLAAGRMTLSDLEGLVEP
jgi:16S rRNA processing protein RimM